MGFDTLTAIGNFRLDRDFNPAVKDPVKIERVIWIGEWPHGSGKWFINVETQFGWMNFSDVTVTFAKTGVANSFNGSVFKTGIYRVSVNSTFDGTTLVTEGSPDAPVSSLNLGNWNESGAPRPTIAQALSGPIVDLLDDDYFQNIMTGPGTDVIEIGSNGGYVDAGEANDFVTGSAVRDEIFGQGGNDELKGGGGNDLIDGGDENDRIFGDGEDDELHGGHGSDTINGGAGDDRIFGGDNDDILNGGPDNDEIRGGAGKDTIRGGGGDDTIWPDGGGDTKVFGGPGNDTIFGAAENEHLFGGLNDDFIFGFDGVDVINGGAGIDRLAGGTGADSISGGAGNDKLFAGHEVEFLTYDMRETDGNNTLRGGANADFLHSLTGAAGGDTLYGGKGNDIFIVNDNDVVKDFHKGDVAWHIPKGNFEFYSFNPVKRGVEVKFFEGAKPGSLQPGETFTLEGAVRPDILSSSVASDQSHVSIRIDKPLAASRAEIRELGQMFRPLGDRVGEIVAEHGGEAGAQQAIETITEEVLKSGNTVPKIVQIFGTSGAKVVASAFASVAGTVWDHATGEFDGYSNGKIALTYGLAASAALIPFLVAGTSLIAFGTAAGVALAAGPALVDLYVEHQYRKMVKEIEDNVPDLPVPRLGGESEDFTVDSDSQWDDLALL